MKQRDAGNGGRIMVEMAIGDPLTGARDRGGRAARTVTINLAESPLGWLFARDHVSPRQLQAGERLRADWERGQLASQVTMA